MLAVFTYGPTVCFACYSIEWEFIVINLYDLHNRFFQCVYFHVFLISPGTHTHT